MHLLWNQGQYWTEAERKTTGGAEAAWAGAGELAEQTERGTRPHRASFLLKSLSLMNETRLCPKLETRVRQLSCEQSNIQEQNQQLRSLNLQLQEQVERSREQLQAALAELGLLQGQEQVARQRWVDRTRTRVPALAAGQIIFARIQGVKRICFFNKSK